MKNVYSIIESFHVHGKTNHSVIITLDSPFETSGNVNCAKINGRVYRCYGNSVRTWVEILGADESVDFTGAEVEFVFVS